MVSVHAAVSCDTGAARKMWAAREAEIRAPAPPSPVPRRRASDAETALHLKSRMIAPFVAQVLAQHDGATEGTDPAAAITAYARAGTPYIAPLELGRV